MPPLHKKASKFEMAEIVRSFYTSGVNVNGQSKEIAKWESGAEAPLSLFVYGFAS